MTSTAGPPAALYEGVIVHSRRSPVAHTFHGAIAMPLVDLERLTELRRLWPLWSSRRAAAIRHRREDYGGSHRKDPGDASLAELARDLVTAETGVRPTGPVLLLAHARTWGWLFNPLAVYFCHDRDGVAVAAVLEVTNTPWGERHRYVVPLGDGPASVSVRKEMHVSPFLEDSLDYEIRVTPPGERFAVTITVRREREVLLTAALSLRRRRFDRRGLLRMLLRHPLMTHRVSAGIYLQAARLWRKRVRYVPHPGNGRTARARGAPFGSGLSARR